MRAFISHTFAGDVDPHLAQTLKEELAAAGIDGYMAEDIRRYDLLIHDKIRQAIDESGWLVAVITRAAQGSASVHEEIGYALGRDTGVIIMLEKGVEESGVLVYGKEAEVFTVPEFGAHAKTVAEFIRDAPTPRPPGPERSGPDAGRLLDDRGILSEKSDGFALNKHYARLYSGTFKGAEKPAFLFTACPRDLGRYCDAMASEFTEWARGIRHFDVKGHRIPVKGNDHEIAIGELAVIERQPGAPPDRDMLSYREFRDNGFFEYGASHPYTVRNLRAEPSLDLCRLIGDFWGFLLHARLFYQKIGMKGPLVVLLCIRNSFKLALGNYGDEVAHLEWSYAKSDSLGRPEPHTGRRHIRLLHAFDSVPEMTDQAIADVARGMARKMCNAYGQDAPKCYNSCGEFSWKLWEMAPR